MKKWGVRILSAFLTLTLGLCAAGIVRFRLAPVAKVETVVVGADIQAQLPPTQIAEDAQPANESDGNAQSTKNDYEPIKPHPVSISPYKIKRLVEQDKSSRRRKEDDLDFESILNRLEIKPDVYTAFDHAEISTFQLDNKPGEETVLRLYADEGWQSIYLIFKQGAVRSNARRRWILLGYIDAFTWIDNPQIRVESVGTNHWLVIRHCAWHGSGGYYRENDDWYVVSDHGVIPALSYYDFDSGGTNPNRESKTKVLKSGFIGGAVTILLQVSDTYKGYTDNGDSLPLWEDRKKVTFIRPLDSSKFVPAPHNSEISEEEICALSDSDGHCSSDDYDTTHFLQYNYQELAKIAARGNAKQKEWLRNYLDTSDESIEKQSLQKALEGAQP
jgi:hypothetical protein